MPESGVRPVRPASFPAGLAAVAILPRRSIMAVEGSVPGETRISEERAFQGGELARAYVPVQVYSQRLSPLEGWKEGTIFPELIRPYPPHRRMRRRW